MGPRKYGRNLFFEHFGGKSHYIVHDFSNCLTAKPAPRTTRPLAGLPNPYPYGCSVLCNHPRDPELKDVVWRPRMSSNHDGGAEHFDNTKTIKRASRTGSATDGGAFVYHSGWDQKISGLGTLAEVGADPLASAAQLAIRRCASGGPSPVERRSAKTEGMLVLDLRPWKSFDNISSVTEAHYDNFDNFERFELTSPRTRQDKPGRSTRPTRRPETFPSKSFKEGKKMPKQLSRNRGMHRNASDLAADQLDGNNVLSGYENNSLSGSAHDIDLEDDFSITKTEDGQSFREPKIDGNFVNGTDVQQLQVCEDPIAAQPTSLEDLEEQLRNVLVQDENENDDESRTRTEEAIEDMTWLLFPRAGNTFGARFELPIDLRKSSRLFSTICCCYPLSSTFERRGFRSTCNILKTSYRGLKNIILQRIQKLKIKYLQKLFLALTEILGFHLDSQAEEKLSELIELPLISELSREQFAGIGALAERIGRSEISRRDDLEVSDFNLLQQKMSYLQMNQSLRRLFLFISQNNPE